MGNFLVGRQVWRECIPRRENKNSTLRRTNTLINTLMSAFSETASPWRQTSGRKYWRAGGKVSVTSAVVKALENSLREVMQRRGGD